MNMLRVLPFALLLLGGTLLPGRLSAQVQAGEDMGPDTVVFTPERGNVIFTHRKHADLAECEACHHESKAEKPLESPRQKCSTCHTNPPTAPMKTDRGMSMHDTDNEAGICFDCHLKEEEAGKKVPVRCSSCHKKEGDPGTEPRDVPHNSSILDRILNR